MCRGGIGDTMVGMKTQPTGGLQIDELKDRVRYYKNR